MWARDCVRGRVDSLHREQYDIVGRTYFFLVNYMIRRRTMARRGNGGGGREGEEICE